MGRSRKKGEPKSRVRDTYDISGKVEGRPVIVQGPEAHVQVTQRDATSSENLQQAELADLDLLRRTLSTKMGNLKKQINASVEQGHNPYRFGQALSFREASLFAGREAIVRSTLDHLKKDHSVFLAGNGGSGKTSLLQAGLMPPLIKQGDLPIFVSVTTDSLELSIQMQFLPEVAQTLYLSTVPLSTFLRHVTESLPATKHVYILIDDLEEFLARETPKTESFKQQLLQALRDSPRIHWLFSIHLGFSHLLNFFRPDINPFAELAILPPFDREAARQAIVQPASLAGIQIDEAVSNDILDRLGDSNISPAQLQTVCYLMAGGNGPVGLDWRLADYEAEGRADGILRQSLERLIGQLKREDREPAWQVLAALVQQEKENTSFEGLANHIRLYGIGSQTLSRLLRLLEEIHLIDVKDEQYYLTSSSLRPRIQQWIQEQNALVQARQEALNQLRQLRNSALRGMFGGALGFILFDLLIYVGDVPELSYRILFLTQVITMGGLAGFLITLTVDLAIATYRGAYAWLRYLVGGLGGIIAFVIGLLLYIISLYSGDSLSQRLWPTILEGALWGAIIGLGTTYALSSTRKAWMIVLLTAIAGGVILWGLEVNFGVLSNQNWNNVSSYEVRSYWRDFLLSLPAGLRIFLAGMLVPLCYMAAALFRRLVSRKEGEL